jgi:hypothetical protein
MRARATFSLAVLSMAMLFGAASIASETTTYTYDALGRLVTSTRRGGPSSGVNMASCFDRAGNRLRYDTLTSTPAACPTPTPTPTPG